MPALAAAVILLFSSVNVVNKRLNLKTLEVSKHHQTETPRLAPGPYTKLGETLWLSGDSFALGQWNPHKVR